MSAAPRGAGEGERPWTGGAPGTVTVSLLTVLQPSALVDDLGPGRASLQSDHVVNLLHLALQVLLSDSSSSSPNFYHLEDHYMRNGVLMPNIKTQSEQQIKS